MPRRAIATPERILTAAFTRFAHYGFRRTSMEDIADEAGVSRAALYLQFRNKEEIFQSLSRQLHEDALARAAAALNAPQALAERLRAAVEAKSLRFVEIAYGSPHGSELLDESNRLCGELAARSEARFRELVTAVLRRAGRAGELDLAAVGLTAGEAAALVVRAAAGLKGPGVTVEEYRGRLAALVRVLVAGFGAAGAAPATAARRTAGRGRATARRTAVAAAPGAGRG